MTKRKMLTIYFFNIFVRPLLTNEKKNYQLRKQITPYKVKKKVKNGLKIFKRPKYYLVYF